MLFRSSGVAQIGSPIGSTDKARTGVEDLGWGFRRCCAKRSVSQLCKMGFANTLVVHVSSELCVFMIVKFLV